MVVHTTSILWVIASEKRGTTAVDEKRPAGADAGMQIWEYYRYGSLPASAAAPPLFLLVFPGYGRFAGWSDESYLPGYGHCQRPSGHGYAEKTLWFLALSKGSTQYSGIHSKVSQYALKYTDEKWMTEYLAAEDYGMDLSREMNLFVISGLSSLLISRHTEGFQNTPANGPDCLSDAV